MYTDTFDWLKEYGPHWQPNSLAFWLAPDTENELRAWFKRYQPAFRGVVEWEGRTVEIAAWSEDQMRYVNSPAPMRWATPQEIEEFFAKPNPYDGFINRDIRAMPFGYGLGGLAQSALSRLF